MDFYCKLNMKNTIFTLQISLQSKYSLIDCTIGNENIYLFFFYHLAGVKQ